MTPLLQPGPAAAEQQLALGIQWARSSRLVAPGQYAVLLRGQVAGEGRSRAVLVRQVAADLSSLPDQGR